VCFTELDGKTKIKPKEIVKMDDEWIFLVPVKVEPNKDCGFYIYYGNKNDMLKEESESR